MLNIFFLFKLVLQQSLNMGNNFWQNFIGKNSQVLNRNFEGRATPPLHISRRLSAYSKPQKCCGWSFRTKDIKHFFLKCFRLFHLSAEHSLRRGLVRKKERGERAVKSKGSMTMRKIQSRSKLMNELNTSIL